MAFSFYDQCKFCLFMPVCCYRRIFSRQSGNIFLNRKVRLSVLCLFFCSGAWKYCFFIFFSFLCFCKAVLCYITTLYCKISGFFFSYNSIIIHFLLCLNVILAKQHTEDYNNWKEFTKSISYIMVKIMIKNGGMIRSHIRFIQKLFGHKRRRNRRSSWNHF